MGWKDAPVIEATSAGQPAWMSAPEVGEEKTIPKPSMGAVALNAIPKGVANLANTPVTLWNLAKTAAGAMHPQIKESATMTPNYPQEWLTKAGIIDPANEPQTPSQRIVDTAIQSGIGMAVAPAKSIPQVLGNLATGALGGGAAQTTKEATGSDAAAIGVGMATPFALQGVRRLFTTPSPLNNPVRNEVLAKGQEAGYVVPPSTVNPSWVNNRLESLAGKAAVKQEANLRNVGVTNELASQALNLPKESTLTQATLKTVREQASQPYKEVAALSPVAGKTLDKLKTARHEATSYYRFYERSADPQALKKAKMAESLAEKLEAKLETIAQKAGKPELIDALREGRQQIAKTYDVERALNTSDANVSAAVMGRALDQGKPLTGELKTIGDFANAFPQVSREGAMVPAAGVSGTDPMASAVLGGLGYGATGNPAGLAAGILPLVRGPSRAAVLSPYYQRLLAQPATAGAPLSTTAVRSALLGRAILDRQQQGVQP